MRKAFMFATLMLGTLCVAAPTPSKPHDSDKSVGSESGFRFGDKGDMAEEGEAEKMNRASLEELIKIEREQLKVQKRILALIEQQVDPKPETITRKDGSKCIANSSADCFKMPLEPFAKRIPVLANWVTNPSKETGKEWLRWQATYFNHVFKSANAARFAIAQYGNEAYPTSYQHAGFETAKGANSVMLNAAKAHLVNAMHDKVHLFLFMGMNSDMDLLSYLSYAKLKAKLPDVKMTIVFYSEEAKGVFDDMVRTLPQELQSFSDHTEQIVNRSYFKKYGIYTTPELATYLPDEQKIDIVLSGRAGTEKTIGLIADIMEYRGVLDHTALTDYKMWEMSGGIAKDHYKDFFHKDINTTEIRRKYQEGMQ